MHKINRIEFDKKTIKKAIKEETNTLRSEAKKAKQNQDEAFDIINKMHYQISRTDEYLNRLIMQKDVNKSELIRLRNILHGHDEKSVVTNNQVFGKRKG